MFRILTVGLVSTNLGVVKKMIGLAVVKPDVPEAKMRG